MKKILSDLKKIDYRHYIAVSITIIFLCFTLFYFKNSITRNIESFKDLGLSFAFYIQELFYFDWGIIPSVINKSSAEMTPIFDFPYTYEEFVVVWKNYWQIIATKENIQEYLSYVGDVLYYVSRYILLLGIPLILLVNMLFNRYMTNHNNNYNVDSKPLKIYKSFCKKIVQPIKNWIDQFNYFVKTNINYWYLWIFIWCWNFNIIVIFVEFIAYYLFFVSTFHIDSLYMQVYKLMCDISTPIAFIPMWCWIIIGYLVLCKIRQNIGYSRLNHFERRNRGFINEQPIVMMVCGSMGSKKTTIITDIGLSQDVMLKNKAYEKILENDLKFPYFPWINLENTLKRAMKEHRIYNLATTKQFIYHIRYCFEVASENPSYAKSIKRHLKKDYYCNYNNLCFDYDLSLYPFYYDDKLKVVSIFDVIENYSQLYFVYIIESSYIISNYSIRTDNLIDDVGNFPLWNTDFFQKDSRLIDSFSRHSHIVDFDSLRLGRKIIEDNPKKDMFEFGVINLTEIGKERKNNLELKETKKREEGTNQKNDGFNDWLKMVRHSATIDMFPFVKVITDEQRPESWGADARDLLNIVHIRETGDFNLCMPFFTITELLYMLLFSKFENLYNKYRYIRGDNTLPMYLLKSITSKFNHYYKGIYNTFGVCVCKCEVERGTQDSQLNEKKYYLMSKKIYSKRFSTDCFSDFFNLKARKSGIGIEDLEEYGTEKATFEELQKQNSYFMIDLMNKKEKEN